MNANSSSRMPALNSPVLGDRNNRMLSPLNASIDSAIGGANSPRAEIAIGRN